MEQHRDRIAAAFERELARSPLPPELRAQSVRGAMLKSNQVALPRQPWALALVATLIAVAIVATLIGVRALHFPVPTPIKHGPPIPLHRTGQIVMGGDSHVTAIDPTTGVRSTILSVAEDDVVTDVAYSPDGSKLAYLLGLKVAGGGGEVWVRDARAGPAKQIAVCDCAAYSQLSWSPDGSRLVFSDGGQLYLIEADGSHKTQLTHLPAGSMATAPSWSPDGTRIVFTTQHNIDVIRTDGSGLAVLYNAPDPYAPFDPAWSPDGSRIAYVLDPPSPQNFEFQLWLMDPDGSYRTKIFVSPGCCVTAWGGPAWSPDGTQLAVVAYPSWSLWVVDADGSNPRNLGTVPVSRPAWQPQP